MFWGTIIFCNRAFGERQDGSRRVRHAFRPHENLDIYSASSARHPRTQKLRSSPQKIQSCRRFSLPRQLVREKLMEQNSGTKFGISLPTRSTCGRERQIHYADTVTCRIHYNLQATAFHGVFLESGSLFESTVAYGDNEKKFIN